MKIGSYTFDNLAEIFDENGQEIDYVLEEQVVNADDMKFIREQYLKPESQTCG